MKLEPLLRLGRPARYAVLVLLPTFVVLAYLGLIASDGYVGKAEVMIQKESTAIPTPDAAISTLLGSAPSKTDALVVKTFMESRAMLDHLEQELDFREHFMSQQIDFWGRLDSDASDEDVLDYYRRHLSVELDEESYILSIEFTAYDPEFANRVTELLVAHSEGFVNDVSQYLAKEQMKFVEKEVDRAHEKLKEASREMVQLQRKHEVLNPERESEAAGAILGGLLQELAVQRTELKALTSYLNPSASEVVATKRKIKALEQQIEQEREKLVGADQYEGLNDLMLAYQDSEANLTVATEVYKTAIGTLEATRLDTARKVKYLVSVSPPAIPDEAGHPRVAYWTLSIFVFLNLIYFVMGLIIATIQDHRE